MKVKIYIMVMFILLLSFNQSFGQQRTWSPPDKMFSVKVPVELKEFPGALYEGSPEVDKITKVFGAIQDNYIFKVVILGISSGKKQQTLKDKLAGMEFVLGGDDDHEFTETFLKVEGLPSKEIVYTNQNTKGLMIDAGDRIYILGLSSKDRKDLKSNVAKRFFKSFHLLKPKK